MDPRRGYEHEIFSSDDSGKAKTKEYSCIDRCRGKKLTTYTKISNEVVSFFQKLLGAVDGNVNSCPTIILEELLHSIAKDAQANLVRPITPAEIKEAIFSIKGDKAPGPDGYSSQFFKTS